MEVMATGSEEQLESMRKQLERGPRFSKVSGVQEVEAQREAQREPLHENAFVIAPDA